MIIGVDHVLIAVEGVEQASEIYRRLGFQVMAGGEHPRMGTYNALVPLSDGAYLELIGVRDRDKATQFPNTREVVAALGRDNRLATMALDTNDIEADVQALRWRGLAIADPVEGERLRPDGQKVAWRSAHFENPNLPFLIQDVTPHHVRVPPPDQGLGAHGYLAAVEIAVNDLAGASRVWKDLLGKIPPEDTKFELERAQIHLTASNGGPAGLRGLSIAVEDLERQVEGLREHGIRVTQHGGRTELDPSQTAGARITLARAS